MGRCARSLVCLLLLVISGSLAAAWGSKDDDPPARERLDPAAWGSDHVGKPTPAYVTGDECLFCHRTIGPTWPDNRHQLTMRLANPDDSALGLLREIPSGKELVAEVQYLLGSKRMTRFLRRSNEYGKLELLSTAAVPPAPREERDESKGQAVRAQAGELKHAKTPHWDKQTFGERCAGCHTTAVTTQTRAFSATSLDCFTCHGDVSLEHTSDVGRVILSEKNREPRQVVSICGQCHLRGGKSKSSGLPYPNTFVAGDNLFRDYQVDFSDATLQAEELPAIDKHIFLNTRDVALSGRTGTTCVTCHDVHGQSSEKHQQLGDQSICASCHAPGTGNRKLQESVLPRNARRAQSRVCDY